MLHRRPDSTADELRAAFTARRPDWAWTAVVAVAGWLGLVALLSFVGVLITRAGPLGAARGWERSVNQWFADGRSPTLNGVSTVASRIGDTETVIAVMLLVAGLLAVRRRWRDAALLPVALTIEVAVFGCVNYIVARPRPAVVKYGEEPSTDSFPSGHVAASVVLWTVIAMIVAGWVRGRDRRAARPAADSRSWTHVVPYVVAAVVVLAVAWARVYRGMHHPLDIVFGAVMGGGSLLTARIALRPGRSVRRPRARPDDPEPRTLDPGIEQRAAPAAAGGIFTTHEGTVRR